VTYLATHPGTVLVALGEHLALVAVSLVLALAVAFPLGVLCARRPRWGALVITAASILYTIPSLALLAVLVLWLGIGPRSAIVALVLYAQLALIRGIAGGLRGVDPALVDAARGLGMTELQTLLRVELRAALPVILAGVRVAAVTLVALATVAGWIAAGGLGTLIFLGLSLHHNGPVIAGALAAAALAIVLDLALRTGERFART